MYHFICSGLDYNTARIAEREIFSLTKSKQAELYEYLRSQKDVLGAVLISTCNRMELCLSLAEGSTQNPFALVCDFLSVDFAQYHSLCKTYTDRDAMHHLCLLSCGACSQIFGEDQIITQMKHSIHYARELEMADSLLEVLFRTAITCGKKIKSTLPMTHRETSIADHVVQVLAPLAVANIMVIGNGEMGRHVAQKLVSQGYTVWMSVREYRHKKVSIPTGVTPFDYDQIYQKMDQMDAVVSATLSPHFTIDKARFAPLLHRPKYLFDLAVPRDIDSEIATLGDVIIYDVDTLSKGGISNTNDTLLAQIAVICEKYLADFDKWYQFKQKLVIYDD